MLLDLLTITTTRSECARNRVRGEERDGEINTFVMRLLMRVLREPAAREKGRSAIKRMEDDQATPQKSKAAESTMKETMMIVLSRAMV